jgi:hypothetical protein
MLIFNKILKSGIIIGLLYLLTNIEYDNFKLSGIVYPLIWISLPIILRYILVKEKISRGTYLIGIVVFIFITIFHLLSSIFCAWSNHSALYKSKSNESITIVCRTYDCYGTAEDCRLYEVIKLTTHFKWVTKFNEKIVDSTKWEKVPFNPEIFNQ